MIYLDHNATTPVDPRVLETMLPYFSEKFGNAASHTHAFGWVAAQAVEEAREEVAALIGTEPNEIVFTSGATESINLALKGVFEAYRSKGNHFITVQTEHKAVLDTCLYLEKHGAEITRLAVDREGLVDPEELRSAIRPTTVLACVMMANNETGVIQPIQKIAGIAHENGLLMMCDATQAAGKIPLDVNAEGIDLLCLSAHKFYGPKGSGALFVRRKNPRVKLMEQIHGGGHENGLRSGTLNVPGIVGMGRAGELAMQELFEDGMRISRMRTELEQTLVDLKNDAANRKLAMINGSIRHRLPNTTNISFEGIRAHSVIKELPDLALATGSACTSALPESSHVLAAMGLSKEAALSAVRFSLGKFTTEIEIKETILTVQKAVDKLRSMGI